MPVDMDKFADGIVTLFRLVFSTLFFKAVIGLSLLVYIASLLPWTSRIYDQIFPRPELRINETGLPQDTQIRTEWQYQRMVVIENRGNGTANQVYVTASIPGEQITRYEVYSDYPCVVHSSTNTSKGYLALSLERLAPGAKVTVYLWGPRLGYVQGTRVFAAVYDAGSAPKTDEPTSQEQIRDLVYTVLTSFQKSFALATEKLIDVDAIRSITVSQIPPHVTISVIALVVLAWLFLSPTHAAIIHGSLAAFLVGTFLPPVVIPSLYMALSTVPFLVLNIVKIDKMDKAGIRSRVIVLLSGLFLVFVFFDAYGNLPVTTHNTTDIVTAGYLATVLSMELL